MIDSSRMAAIDRNAAALGVDQAKLMESAGNAVARAVREEATEGDHVAIVAGRGNNGGDAFVAARFLDELDVTVHLLGRPAAITTDIARENWEALEAAEAETRIVRDSTALDLGEPDVVVDGILGTGVKGPPREPERSAIVAVNGTGGTVVAVDVPSGMDVDTGEVVDVAVEADRVITFHDQKPGLADRDDVTIADIGIPPAAETFVGAGDLFKVTRPAESHKGDFGRVMVIGGGPYTGAPALAGQAALRAGADLAFISTPEPVADDIQGFSEDLIVEPLLGTRLLPEHADELLERAANRDAVVIGPGLGEANDTQDAVAAFLSAFDGRAVVDADALQVVREIDTDATLVCTPHQGEFVEMGGERAADWRERADIVETYAADLGHTMLVKGRYDIVSDGETTRVNRSGNQGMTVGGTGDVLSGATAAFLARLDPVEAAAVGAYATGKAGDLVADESGFGLLASDLLETLPTAVWEERI
ncbi:MAG: NAD(P)H-hydrate dehydratase [Halodesulfurarchaeum sp.]